MLNRSLLFLCVLCAFLLIGCSKTEMTNNSNSMAGNSNRAMTSTPATSTASSSAGKVGVPECDDYIAKYDACVSGKVPETHCEAPGVKLLPRRRAKLVWPLPASRLPNRRARQ